MKLKFAAIGLITFFSIANAKDNLSMFQPTSSSEEEVLKMIKNPTNQNNTELVMSILKDIEDKGIKDADKKIEFVDSFNVSNDIKEQAKSYIRQNIKYSDNERVSYGVYKLKNCGSNSYASKTNGCVNDYAYIYNGCYVQYRFTCCK